METTGQQIFKRLSGQVANVGSAIGAVKHGIEDMKKEADKASASAQASSSSQNTDAVMKERALEQAQNKIDSKAQQNRDINNRFEEVRSQANQNIDVTENKETNVGGGK